MLVAWGFALIISFIILLMTRRLSALTALVLVPTGFGLAAGFGTGLGPMVIDAMRQLAPTAVMLIFAMLYFMVMTDAGMFDPLARKIVGAVGGDPVKIFWGTITLGFLVALDGDGATVYMIVLSALLPLYRRIGLSVPMVAALLLHCTGLGNMLPWGGPTARAVTAMNAEMSEVFGGLLVPMLVCVIWTYVLAWIFGRRERRRIGVVQVPAESTTEAPAGGLGRGRLAFNWLLTVALIWVLVGEILPPMPFVFVLPMPFVFMMGSAIALVVNFPGLKAQGERLAAHAPAILAVASLIFAASVFTGVLSGTGMAEAMAAAIVNVIPDALGPYLAVVTALISLPVTWMVSNDVFYFGMLPVLAEAAGHYGIKPAEMAIASLIGQPVHILSPLVASTYLLIGMLEIDYAGTQRFVLPFAAVTSLIMLAAALLVGVIPLAR